MTTPSITTRRGDGGDTQLFSGEIVSKDGPRTQAYGDMDELGSVLGVARSMSNRLAVAGALREVQMWLFTANAELATSSEHAAILIERIGTEMVDMLDERCAALEAMIAMPNGFIVPGATVAAAHIDHARTLARRCERRIVELQREGYVDNPHLLAWINRLSDYLWLLARVEEGDAVDLKDLE
jgi:cob(I)alamin adenosyltransferase